MEAGLMEKSASDRTPFARLALWAGCSSRSVRARARAISSKRTGRARQTGDMTRHFH